MRIYITIIILCAFLVSCKDKKYNYKSKGEWVHLKNGETIDGYTRIGDSIYGGYGDFKDYIMEDVSSESFIYIGRGYATDGYKLFKKGKAVNNLIIKSRLKK